MQLRTLREMIESARARRRSAFLFFRRGRAGLLMNDAAETAGIPITTPALDLNFEWDVVEAHAQGRRCVQRFEVNGYVFD